MQPNSRQATTGVPAESPGQLIKMNAIGRVESVDAYRGIVMTLLLFGGFGVGQAAANFLMLYPDNRVCLSIKNNFEHSQWVGCTFWDLIEPSFFFLMGISISLSFHARFPQVSLNREVLRHLARRAGILILIGIVLSLVRQGPGAWGLTNTLTQLGLAYALASLVWNQSRAIKALCVVLILTTSWILYFVYPDAGINVATGDPSVGVSQEWAQSHLATVPAIWHKNANIGHWLDTAVLNFLPRTQPFLYDEEGYQTIAFLPSIALIVLGMLAGELLRCGWTLRVKIGCLAVTSLCGLSLGWLLDATGICPLIKKTYTPSFVIFSAGFCAAILGSLMVIIDWARVRFWTAPFNVVGRNSILAYGLAIAAFPILRKAIASLPLRAIERASEGDQPIGILLIIALPVVEALFAGSLLWLVLYVMHRRSMYLRI